MNERSEVSRLERLVISRKQKLARMTDAELESLNEKLTGKGINFATAERLEVCKELGNRMEAFFADTEI